MDCGIELSSPDELENLSEKYNKFYMIGGIGGAVLGLLFLSEEIGFFGGILLGGLLGLVIGWGLKSGGLKGAKHLFRIMEFKMPENLTLEEIYMKTSQSLSVHGILVSIEKGSLVFKRGSVTYAFTEKKDKKIFTLWWSFSLAKAFLGSSEIKDYETVRKGTGLIAYTIQHCKQE